MNKKILITGGNGYIGSYLVRFYLDKGHHVDNLDIGKLDNNNSHNYFSFDITDVNNFSNIKNNYDIIIHCAGSPSVPLSVENPLFDFSINLQGTINMLEFARLNNSTFIIMSSVSVYDSENNLPLSENSYKKPTSPYGASKLASEAYCQAYFRSFGLDTRIARIFNTYGPGMKHLFISDMIEKINNAEDKIIIGGSGNQIRDYVYIKDLISAIDIIAANGSPGEDYNICSGQKNTLINIANKLINIMGKENLSIKSDGKTYKGDIEEWYGNPNKINSIGFIQNFSIEDGLEETINSKGIE